MKDSIKNMLDQLFRNMPPVVKNLLIINLLFFVAQLMLPTFMQQLQLYPFFSEGFRPYQLATHFFMHSPHNFAHILFNMFALVMFGSNLERVWGPKKFLIFYFSTAFGAAILHQWVHYIEVSNYVASLDANFGEVKELLSSINGLETLLNGQNFTNPIHGKLNIMFNIPMLGASGAIFGLLAAFAFLFPNTELMLLFPPIPIKAKYFVLGYAALELYLGMANQADDNVAHFAHLGGAIIGFILVYIWNKNRTSFY